MSTILACGFLPTVCQSTQQFLQMVGINKPRHTAHGGYSAAELVERFFAANVAANSISEENWRTQEIAEAWRLAAADLVVANAMNAPWGWANKQNLYFFHYWQTVATQSRYIIVYSSLARALADTVQIGATEIDQFQNIIEQWKAYHWAMLKFCRDNRDVSIVLDADVLIHQQGEAAALIIEKCGLNSTARPYSPFPFESVACVFEALALQASSTDEEVMRIQETFSEEFDISPDIAAKTDIGILISALREIDELKSPNIRSNDQLFSSVGVGDSGSGSDASYKSKFIEAQEEIGLLKRQLSGLRGELSAASKTVTAAKKSSPKNENNNEKIPDIVVNMCGPIDGENWLPAGPEGRWAGPETVSTLKIPPLQKGKYKIEIGVLSTMAADILRGMKVSVDGDSIQFAYDGEEVSSSKPLFLRKQKERKIKLPANLIGILNVKSKTDDEKMKLRFEFPRTLVPASQPASNSKKLAVRLSHISLIAQQ